MSSLSNATEEQVETFERFVSLVNNALDEVFGKQGATMILGLQWGEMGRSGQPICLVSSNMPVCAVGAAITDMAEEVEMLHRAAHGLPETEESDDLSENVALADAPEEVQSMVRGLMEQFGVTEDQVQIVHHVDTSDLADLPVTGVLGDEPQPGDPTTVEGTD